jgi:hypothetical protein
MSLTPWQDATSPLRSRPNGEWSDLERDSQFVHPNFYDSYGDTRVGKGRLHIPPSPSKPIEVWAADAVPSPARVPLAVSPQPGKVRGNLWRSRIQAGSPRSPHTPVRACGDPTKEKDFSAVPERPSTPIYHSKEIRKAIRRNKAIVANLKAEKVVGAKSSVDLLMQVADQMKAQHDHLCDLLQRIIDGPGPNAPKRPFSAASVAPASAAHVSKKVGGRIILSPNFTHNSQQKQRATSISLDLRHATTRLTSLALDAEDHDDVSINIDHYLDFTPKSDIDDGSLSDSLVAQCSPWKADDVAESADESCIRMTKPMRDFWRATGMNEYDMLGAMGPWPRASSMMSMFGPPQDVPETDSEAPAETTDSGTPFAKGKAPRRSPAKVDECLGLGPSSRPISAMPAAPTMKRRDTAELAAIQNNHHAELKEYLDRVEYSTAPYFHHQDGQGGPESRREGVQQVLRRDTPIDDAIAAEPSAAGPSSREENMDKEQRRIHANFAEFLAKAEARRAAGDKSYDNMVGVAQDPETKEYEAIFLEDSDSPSTTDISASQVSDPESNPWWNLRTQ